MRAEPKNTTVSRIFSPEMRQRLQILRENAQRPGVRAVQKLLVQVGDRPAP
jgi:predicted DNA-binding protein